MSFSKLRSKKVCYFIPTPRRQSTSQKEAYPFTPNPSSLLGPSRPLPLPLQNPAFDHDSGSYTGIKKQQQQTTWRCEIIMSTAKRKFSSASFTHFLGEICAHLCGLMVTTQYTVPAQPPNQKIIPTLMQMVMMVQLRPSQQVTEVYTAYVHFCTRLLQCFQLWNIIFWVWACRKELSHQTL